jgi:hypothetical protein
VVLLVLIAISWKGALLSADENPLPQNDLMRLALESKDRDVLARTYKSLFKKIERKEISEMQMHSDDSVALHAAWELLKRDRGSEPTKKLLTDKQGQRDAERTEPEVAQRFLGFAEGRLQSALPKWWEETILDARAYDNGVWYFPTPHGLSLAKEAKITKEGKYYIISQSGDTFIVATRTVEAARNSTCDSDIAACMDSSRCFLGLHGISGFPFVLICIDRATGKLVWRTSVWATGRTMLFGIDFHRVSLRVNKKHIIVYGRESGGMYIEKFDIQTGDNVLRFSTCYWSVDGLKEK